MSSAVTFTARVLFESAPKPNGGSPPGVRVTAREERIDEATLERAIASAWYWPEARAEIAKHHGVLEVALAAEVGSPVERALAVTKAVTALATKPGCVAVLWDATTLVHEPAQWMAQAEDASKDDLPLFLWLAFEGTETTDGSRTLRTRGARDFGANEVEVAGSKRDGEEVLETVCDVALYVMTSPVPLEDGDQVEVTRGKVRVRVEPSLRNDGSRAYRLRLP
ncbi:DUF4261 domain-containing protein [Sandaracinus amylolyticus]|uniref:DUF4261 domain-containing protein n=1 Tax=Sandaracinus amylolyticus TaxID=927083 RepID=UPI001F407F13|nr:DUF4261 domain-containing protein [Sandaracinus amylolyticus]UJR85240.1 Hypothetical protein I5071_73200 [Sandaracinus amylolyticus]